MRIAYSLAAPEYQANREEGVVSKEDKPPVGQILSYHIVSNQKVASLLCKSVRMFYELITGEEWHLEQREALITVCGYEIDIFLLLQFRFTSSLCWQ